MANNRATRRETFEVIGMVVEILTILAYRTALFYAAILIIQHWH